MQPAEHHRRGERKLALRLGLLAAKPALGCVKLIEHAAGGFEIAPAGFGERKAAGRPREKPQAKLLLKRGQMPADGRERHAQAASGSRETPGVGDSNEDAHGGEAIHSIVPKIGNINWNNRQYSPRTESTI